MSQDTTEAKYEGHVTEKAVEASNLQRSYAVTGLESNIKL